jgi:UDP-N-acetylmuramoylalanine--D-glutamate ligase
MNENYNIFINKKILIYGIGKSGISTFNFLKKNNHISLFDDNKKIRVNKISSRIITSSSKIQNFKFDIIILSPGIDINKCKLKKFLKKNLKIIYTDLDVFYSFYPNQCITITGTNGKSTTCQLLYEVLKKQGFDVKLAGNIGYPILSIKKIKRKSIFVVEASSYQLDYSKLFNSKYAVILNISADHLERHKTLKNYISAKFKLIKNQKNNSIAFINKHDLHINAKIKKKNNIKSKIVKVNTKLNDKFLKIFDNNYFLSSSNRENLSFVLEISKKFKVKKNILINVIKKFKGLKYRQQIIFDSKNISIINDSKSTSYSSSLQMLKQLNNIYWLLGGIPKKGDKLNLSKIYYKNIKGFIFGKNFKKFSMDLNNKIKFKKFSNLKEALNGVFQDIKKDNSMKKTILFSPAAASFDSFKNFEDRGSSFDKLIKKNFNVK